MEQGSKDIKAVPKQMPSFVVFLVMLVIAFGLAFFFFRQGIFSRAITVENFEIQS